MGGRTRRCSIRRPLYVLLWVAGLSARLPLLSFTVRLRFHRSGKEYAPGEATEAMGKIAFEFPGRNLFHPKGKIRT
jgi:hypothetical protein